MEATHKGNSRCPLTVVRMRRGFLYQTLECVPLNWVIAQRTMCKHCFVLFCFFVVVVLFLFFVFCCFFCFFVVVFFFFFFFFFFFVFFFLLFFYKL